MVPRILVVGVTGIWMLFSVMTGLLSYSRLNGVTTVTEDFCGETFMRFVVSQSSNRYRYLCKFTAALSMLGSEYTIVRSSAYEEMVTSY